MISRVDLKAKAKEKMKGNILSLFVANLIVILITGAIAPSNKIYVIGQLVTIALGVLNIGLSLFYLNYVDKGSIDYGDIFYSFKYGVNNFLKHIGTLLVMGILIFLWSLLLIIPGIIKALAYSQVLFIRAEDPDKDIMQCLRESEELMRGHKAEFFILGLSFILWYILVALTFGIFIFYVAPYVSTTLALYYRQLKPLKAAEAEINRKEPEIA